MRRSRERPRRGGHKRRYRDGPRQAPVPGAQRGKAPEGVEHGVVPRARGPYEIQSGEHALPKELLVGESLDAERSTRTADSRPTTDSKSVPRSAGSVPRRGASFKARIPGPAGEDHCFRRVVVVVVVVASCAFGKRFVYSQRRERRDALGIGRVKSAPPTRATSEPPALQHEALRSASSRVNVGDHGGVPSLAAQPTALANASAKPAADAGAR